MTVQTDGSATRQATVLSTRPLLRWAYCSTPVPVCTPQYHQRFSIRCDEIYTSGAVARALLNKAPCGDAPRERVGRHKRVSTARTEHARVAPPRRETSAASGSATRRVGEPGNCCSTPAIPSAKASAPPRHWSGHTTANTTSTRALPAYYSTPYGSGARPDGSARGDKDGRGGLAEPRHQCQRQRGAATHPAGSKTSWRGLLRGWKHRRRPGRCASVNRWREIRTGRRRSGEPGGGETPAFAQTSGRERTP